MAHSTAVDPSTIAERFHALADPTRVEIVELLRGGERCQCELTDALDATQSRLYFHLKVLKDTGLVTDRKEGRWVYYTLNADALDALADFLTHVRAASPQIDRRSSCCD